MSLIDLQHVLWKGDDFLESAHDQSGIFTLAKLLFLFNKLVRIVAMAR